MYKPFARVARSWRRITPHFSRSEVRNAIKRNYVRNPFNEPTEQPFVTTSQNTRMAAGVKSLATFAIVEILDVLSHRFATARTRPNNLSQLSFQLIYAASWNIIFYTTPIISPFCLWNNNFFFSVCVRIISYNYIIHGRIFFAKSLSILSVV